VSTVSDILQPRFIYLSNCYVFDGNKGNYHENDTVLPSTALGKAKVGGENFIRGKALNHIIVRASPLFGRGNGYNISFLDKLRMKLDRKERVELSSTELHSFAPMHGFIDFIKRLVDSGPRNKTLHYGGLTKATYVDFARVFARRFGYDENLIFEKQADNGLSQSQMSDYSLNSTYVAETLKVKPLLLEESLDLLDQQLIPRF
jgi:dTDP-4-dehydrorhamnose reductase